MLMIRTLFQKRFPYFVAMGLRIPREEDFMSLVAMEMVDRINQPKFDVATPFLDLLSRVADTVRHRVVREVQRLSPSIDNLPASIAPSTFHSSSLENAIARELEESFSLQEQVLLALFVEGGNTQRACQRSPRLYSHNLQAP